MPPECGLPPVPRLRPRPVPPLPHNRRHHPEHPHDRTHGEDEPGEDDGGDEEGEGAEEADGEEGGEGHGSSISTSAVSPRVSIVTLVLYECSCATSNDQPSGCGRPSSTCPIAKDQQPS